MSEAQPSGVREAMGLVALARQLFEQRALGEAREALELALPTLADSDEAYALAICLHYLGATLRELGALEEADRVFRQALPVHRAIDDLEGEARSLSGLALARRLLGDDHEALDLYELCLGRWTQLGEAAQAAFVLNELGVVLRELDRYPEALERLDQALAVRRELGDPEALGITLHNRGVVLSKLGRLDEARASLEEALPLRAGLGAARGAATHHELGQALRKLGRVTEALERLEEALALHEAAGDAGGYASTVNEIGAALIALERNEEAANALEQALPLGEASGDVELLAAMLQNLAVAESNLGRDELAIRRLDGALELRRQAGNAEGEHEILAAQLGTVVSAGRRSYDRGALGVARGHAERALELHELLGSPPHERAETRNALAAILCELGELDAAESHVAQALEEVGAGIGSTSLRASIANTRGLIHHERGDLAEARASYEEALALERDADDERAVALHNVAAVYLDEGDLGHAIELFRQALTAKGGERTRSRATTLNSLGGAYYAVGDLDHATSHFREALEIQKELAPGSTDVAIGLNNLGLVLVATSELDEAVRLFEAALEIATAEAVSGKLKAAALGNIGRAYHYAGEHEAALRYLTKALTIEETTAADSFETALCATSIAAVHCDRAEWAEALPHLEQAVLIGESLRTRAGGQRARELVFAQQQSPFGLLIRCLYHLDREGDRERAFHVAESSRTRTLVELLAERELEINPTDQAQQELVALDRRLRFELASTHNRLESARAAAAPDDLVDALDAAKREIERRLLDVGRRAREIFVEYADLRYPDPFSLKQVQKHLDHETLLLEYALTEAEAFLFCVRRDGFEMVDLPWTADQLTVGCATVLAPFHPVESGLQSGAAALDLARAASQKLAQLPEDADWADVSRLLVGEVASASTLGKVLLGGIPDRLLEGVTRLLIVQDGVLSYLPFELLPSADSAPLLERPYATTYALSATTWISLAESARPDEGWPAGSFVGFGDPAFSRPELARLAGTRNEVERIGSSFSGSHTFLGADANESRAKAEVAGHRFVHFATHGLLSDTSPLHSGLALAAPTDAELENDPHLDDLLQVYEMFDLPLRGCEAVVCSACQTGLGKIRAGEGLLGFSRALLFAGARCVVVSLWPVPDLPTARLMERFYGLLAKELPPAVALREAKRSVRETHPAVYRDPRTWAGFITVGLGW